MKTILVLIVTLFTISLVYAETYKWQDENGVHFTDNASTIPEKYRQESLERARQNNPSQNHQDNQVAPNDLKNRNSSKGTPTFKLPQFPKYSPAKAQKQLERTLQQLGAYITLLVILSLLYFIAWVLVLVDILRSEFYDPTNKILWFVMVFLLPLLGMILYGIIGGRQKRKKYQKEMLDRLNPDKTKEGDFRVR